MLGAVVANLMFDLPAVSVSTHDRGGAGVLLGEVVATFGLVLVVFGSLRTGATAPGGVRGRRLHHRGVLVHQLDQLRQPGGDGGPDVLRHLRRHRAGVVPMFVLMQLLGGRPRLA